MAGWNNLPNGIKPVINNTIAEARQYGKASADYYGYRVIAKTGVAIGTVFVYVLNDTKADAYKAKGFISAGVKLEAVF